MKELEPKGLEGIRVFREGKCVYAQIHGGRAVYICRYTNEKAVAAIVAGWLRARGFDV